LSALTRSLHALFPRSVRTFPPEEVTTRSEREVDPADVGMTSSDVEAIWRSVVRFYRTGLHPAIAICVRRRGEVILDRAIGHTRGNGPGDPPDGPKELARPDGLYSLFSGSKPITAMLVHLLHERELLHVDEPVVTFIPEFAQHRKHRITIADILTHRAGIPAAPQEVIDLDLLSDWDRIMEVICAIEPVSQPGEMQAYHAVTGGFVLAEIIQRVTGKDIRAFLQEEITRPLGMDYFDYGVPAARLGEVARESFTGPDPVWPAAHLIESALGLPMEQLVEVANDPRFRTGIVPAGNLTCTPNDACRFFELLLCGGTLDGKRIFDYRTVSRAIAPRTDKLDRTLMVPVRYSMGFLLGTEGVGLYGLRAPRAFGHPGFTNVIAYADPERDLSVAMMNNGKPLLSFRLVAFLDVMRTLSSRVPRDRRES